MAKLALVRPGRPWVSIVVQVLVVSFILAGIMMNYGTEIGIMIGGQVRRRGAAIAMFAACPAAARRIRRCPAPVHARCCGSGIRPPPLHCRKCLLAATAAARCRQSLPSIRYVDRFPPIPLIPIPPSSSLPFALLQGVGGSGGGGGGRGGAASSLLIENNEWARRSLASLQTWKSTLFGRMAEFYKAEEAAASQNGDVPIGR